MSDWKEKQDDFTSFDGVRIHYRHLIPKETPHHAVLLVHGGFEHAGRYGRLYEYFLPLGYEFYAPDHRGHGRSEGQPGHVNKFADYIEDIEQLRKKFTSEQPNPGRSILIGNSLGGLIALKYALEHPEGLLAIIISGPLLKLTMPVPGWKKALGNVMSKILPTFSISVEVQWDLMSHDPQLVPDVKNDPLINNMVSAKFYSEMIAAIEDVHLRAEQFHLPILILHGSDDIDCAPEGSEKFYEHCGSKDKTLKIYPGLYHELFNELDYKQVMADIEDWLKKRGL